MKKPIKYGIIMVVVLLIFLGLMCISYALPNEPIVKNIKESMPQIEKEGLYPTIGATENIAKLDNFTDAIILNIAMDKANKEKKSVMERVLNNPYYRSSNQNPIEALKNAVEQRSVIDNNKEYSRYWFGVLVVIRPLLIFFNYMEIRYILMIILFLLLSLVASSMAKQLNSRYVLFFFLSLAMMNIICIPLCIQFISIVFITLISMLTILWLYKKQKQKYLLLVMMIIGMVSAFFDVLSYPSVTLGFSMITVLLLEQKKQEKTMISLIKMIIACGILWGIGYLATFIAKWILASLILHKDAITPAIRQILFRANGNQTHVIKSRWDAIEKNFSYYFNSVASVIMIIVIIVWIVFLMYDRKNIKKSNNLIPLIIVAILPYVWYWLLAEHSIRHAFFTFRAQSVTCFALLSAMFTCIPERKEIKEKL